MSVKSTRVGVAVSGGVDSLCALLLLKRAGYDVFAIHALLGGITNAETLGLLQSACDNLDVELKTLDARLQFKKLIIEPFAQSYLQGHTPNPCALCNKKIKFGIILDFALQNGAEYLATGHYARISHTDTEMSIKRAHDAQKDQSYFLSLLDNAQISRALFPLAEYSKTRTRQIVAEAGLKVPAPAESQDICFLNHDKSYMEFLDHNGYLLNVNSCGPILLKENESFQKIGEHKGLWRHTIGQRKGLGISWPQPLYVLEKDGESNSLIVGPKAHLKMRYCKAALISAPRRQIYEPGLKYVRVRYNQPLMSARINVKENQIEAEFSQACFPSATGQILAVYDDTGAVLGGGIINETLLDRTYS